MRNIFLVFILALFSCEKKKQADKYASIPFLHQIKGTKNYEVFEIKSGSEVHYDNIGKFYYIKGSKKDYKYFLNGSIKDSFDDNKIIDFNDVYSFVNKDKYSTWLYDGDKSMRKIYDLIQQEEPGRRDSLKYLKKHIEFYKKSKYVIYDEDGSYYYYYYFNNQWYRLHVWGTGWIKKRYPEKLPPPRLQDIKINGLPKSLKQFFAPIERNSINSDAIGAPKNFAMGQYIIRIGLPGGDSLTYRRLGDGLGNLTKFYQLPSSKGGNDSILFISQEYNNQKGLDGSVYFSHGGLFMVRPKRKK